MLVFSTCPFISTLHPSPLGPVLRELGFYGLSFSISLALWLLDVFSQWEVPVGDLDKRMGSGHLFPFLASCCLSEDGFTPPLISTIPAGQLSLVAVDILLSCTSRFFIPRSPGVPHRPLLFYITSADTFENTPYTV